MEIVAEHMSAERSPVPDYAEKHSWSDFGVTVNRPSGFIPGRTVSEERHSCPGCRAPIECNHGQRILCFCGLYFEVWGNACYVWRNDPPIMTDHDLQQGGGP